MKTKKKALFTILMAALFATAVLTDNVSAGCNEPVKELVPYTAITQRELDRLIAGLNSAADRLAKAAERLEGKSAGLGLAAEELNESAERLRQSQEVKSGLEADRISIAAGRIISAAKGLNETAEQLAKNYGTIQNGINDQVFAAARQLNTATENLKHQAEILGFGAKPFPKPVSDTGLRQVGISQIIFVIVLLAAILGLLVWYFFIKNQSDKKSVKHKSVNHGLRTVEDEKENKVAGGTVPEKKASEAPEYPRLKKVNIVITNKEKNRETVKAHLTEIRPDVFKYPIRDFLPPNSENTVIASTKSDLEMFLGAKEPSASYKNYNLDRKILMLIGAGLIVVPESTIETA